MTACDPKRTRSCSNALNAMQVFPLDYYSLSVRSVDVSYELKVIPNTRIALFCRSGPITLEDRKKHVEVMAQFCREHDISQLIVDTRQQASEMTTTEMYDLGAVIPELMRGIHIAVVCQPSDRATQYGETVAANRGADSRSFHTIEGAKAWLAEKEVTLNRPDASDG